MSTTAKIASKGCKDTGITEDIAQTLHNNLGRSVIAVVELVAESRSEKRNGDEAVTLTINYIEPATTAAAEEHLRELQRGLYYERQLADGQAAIDESLAPKVNDVLAQGDRHKPHPFLPVDAADDNGICDVCGIVENGTALHNTNATRNPFEVIQGGDTDDTDDETLPMDDTATDS